jgi:hypothetical protein
MQNAIMQADEEFIKQLLEEEDKAAALAARVFMCPICREDVPIDGCVTLSCEHRYCADCFAGYVESKISEKAVTEASLQCAIPGCTTSITPHVRFLGVGLRRCHTLLWRVAFACAVVFSRKFQGT